jgi:DNA polymerase III delta prime subunit
MNYLFVSNFIVDEDILSKNLATFLCKNPSPKFDWTEFQNFQTDNILTQTLLNKSQIIVLPTDSKQDLSQNLIPLFVKYDQPTFLILGSLSQISLGMQQGLLRFVEEPPKNLNLILTARTKSQALNTLISRCELKTLTNAVALKYIDKTKNEELTQFLPKPKDLIQGLLKNQKVSSPDFKSVSRVALETWLWQLEFITSELIFKNSSNDQLNHIFENILQAKKLNQANVLNRLVWAQLFV